MLRAQRESRIGEFVFPDPTGHKPISNMAMIAMLRKNECR